MKNRTENERAPRKKLLVPLVLEAVLVAATLAAGGCGDDDAPPVDAAVDTPSDVPII